MEVHAWRRIRIGAGDEEADFPGSPSTPSDGPDSTKSATSIQDDDHSDVRDDEEEDEDQGKCILMQFDP
jgi:hypothetical protein